MKHIRRKITLAVLGSVLLVFAVLLSAVNLFIPNYLTSAAKKAILLVEQDDSIIPLNGGEGMSETEDEHFLLTSVKYLEVEGALYETEHLSLAERKLLNHCRKTELAEGEFYTYKTGSSRFVFRLTAVEGYDDEEAYSYILYAVSYTHLDVYKRQPQQYSNRTRVGITKWRIGYPFRGLS